MIGFRTFSRSFKIFRLLKIQFNEISQAITINLPKQNVLLSKTNQIFFMYTTKKQIFGSNSLKSDFSEIKDEELYWNHLKEALKESEVPKITMHSYKMSKSVKYTGDKQGKNVFVLQLKMQYKSKARQSTTAELQLAESISLVDTLENWKVVDSIIIGTKRSRSAGNFLSFPYIYSYITFIYIRNIWEWQPRDTF